ncbi:hypothetical protein KPL74_10900 [Bacillus sp. NP157]|nr:hypothetical protein KPL74_10900 [Bacillus sp. NP157]
MGHRGGIAGLFFIALVAGAHAQTTEPGFFHRMAAAAKQGVNDVVHPGQAQEEPMYAVRTSGARSFEGLFNGTQRPGYSPSIGWPRAAVAFDRFGRNEPCWQGHVLIWIDAHTSTREDFTVCSSPTIAVRDATGQLVQYDSGKADALAIGMLNQSAPDRANSGAQRTTGPIPPLHPFKLNVADTSLEQRGSAAVPNSLGAGIDTSSMNDRYIDMLTRLAVISGYIQPEDFASRASGIVDARMWVVGFDPNGNLDRH